MLGAAIGGVLLLLARFDPPAFAALRGTVAEVTTPVSSGLDWVRRVVGAVPAGIGNYIAVYRENAQLRDQVAAERDLVQQARILTQENRRLRVLLKLRERETETVIAARLVNSSASSTRRFATLNAGFWQGVHPGQPVRGPAGLIGQVTEAGPNTARVLLITDADSIVPVRRIRDNMPAIAAGRGDGLIDIRSAGVGNTPFRAGDTFVTSGTGGIFAPNIPVARVVHDSRDIALAQPSANPDTLDFALVLRTFLPAMPPPPTPTAKTK